jgi:mannose-6-phosphate isomerase-like protein (cupin superfamily)
MFMKKLHLTDLNYEGTHHILINVIPGQYLSKGGLTFKKPGKRTHDMGCSCPACDGNGHHIHPDDCEVFIILQGKTCMEINGELYDMVSGDVIVCESGEDHHLIADKDDPCVNLWLHESDSPFHA